MKARLLWAADKALLVVETGCVLAREFVPRPEEEPEDVVLHTGDLPAGLLAEVMRVTRPR